MGSPPPMRGKEKYLAGDDRNLGITPAYAGKSPTDPPLAFSNQDHPRLCGEKSFPPHGTQSKAGSPPPMRGKGFRCKPLCHLYRITPAYAGKSCGRDSFSGFVMDHPRLCGEKQGTRFDVRG